MEFENLEAVLGRFPTITVDMDTRLNLGTKVTIEVSASVKEIRHEQGPTVFAGSTSSTSTGCD